MFYCELGLRLAIDYHNYISVKLVCLSIKCKNTVIKFYSI